MIEGFEDYTFDLNDGDKWIIDLIASGLRPRIGKQKCITGKEIILAVEKKFNEKINPGRLRVYVQYIRAHGLVPMLCAYQKGYYVAESKEEWHKYIEGFRSRIRSMQFTMACMTVNN